MLPSRGNNIYIIVIRLVRNTLSKFQEMAGLGEVLEIKKSEHIVYESFNLTMNRHCLITKSIHDNL